MNKSPEQNPNRDSATNIYQINDAVPKYRARNSNGPSRPFFLRVSADSVVVNMPQAAAGQQQSIPDIDTMKMMWKHRLGAARFAWGELTASELLEVEGDRQKLIGLVQQRYDTTPDEAARQVKVFFDIFEC